MQRILVTGAAGFIGSHLVDRLLRENHTVIGVDNFDPFYPASEKQANLSNALLNSRFRLHNLDIRDELAFNELVGRSSIDAIVHLAAKAGVRPSIEKPLEYTDVNVAGTAKVLEAARLNGVKRLVFASSSSVYGNNPKVPFSESDSVDSPISPYAATKRAGELLCHTYHHLFGLSIVALRFFTVYGPRQRPDLAIRKFATRMLDGSEIPLYGDGSTARDYTWIDDIVNGVVSAIAVTGEVEPVFHICNLGGSQTTSLLKLVQLLSDAIGVEARISWQPSQPGDVDRTFADLSFASTLLNYHPSTSMADGISLFVSWLRNGALPSPASRYAS